MIPRDFYWPLNDREQAILLMYADGLTSRDIGHELGISPNTAKWYAHRIRLKLEARTIAHAVALAYQYGNLRVAL